jgi:hypothetical protein
MPSAKFTQLDHGSVKGIPDRAWCVPEGARGHNGLVLKKEKLLSQLRLVCDQLVVHDNPPHDTNAEAGNVVLCDSFKLQTVCKRGRANTSLLVSSAKIDIPFSIEANNQVSLNLLAFSLRQKIGTVLQKILVCLDQKFHDFLLP